MARRSYGKPVPTRQDPESIDGIPTAEGLVQMGREYAERVPRGIRITDKGHALLSKLQRERAQENIAKGVWRGVSGARVGGPVPQPGIGQLQRDEG